MLQSIMGESLFKRAHFHWVGMSFFIGENQIFLDNLVEPLTTWPVYFLYRSHIPEFNSSLSTTVKNEFLPFTDFLSIVLLTYTTRVC